MKTRAEIDAELDRLERRLPELVQECPPDEVLEAFAAEAEPLTEQAPAEHHAHITGRINCLLASAGLISGETEGEPCPSGGESP